MILLVLPAQDFDPTEAAVPWAQLRAAGHTVRVATPSGDPASADLRLTDRGFGLLSPMLMTKPAALEQYRVLSEDAEFRQPLTYAEINPADYDGILVPGGHAAGMKTMLESTVLQRHIVAFFAAQKPVAAVCHGVLLLARSIDPATGRSVLYGRRTTALTQAMELGAWALTWPWLGDYYRTYPVTVQAEVTSQLQKPGDFEAGPVLSRPDTASHWQRGFTVRDRNYLSARYPGDCHRFARELVELVELYRTWRAE